MTASSNELRGHYYWTDQQIALLGTMCDKDLGKILGKKKETVAAKRRKLGIACCPELPQPKLPTPPSERTWTDEQIALLGTDSDERIGREIGRTTAAVRTKRIRMGIASIFERPSSIGKPPSDTTENDRRAMRVTRYMNRWGR